jgi:hypothetical protein
MADSNRTELRYDEESSWGTVTGTPKFIDINFVDDSLVGTKETEKSDTIRSDRMTQSIKQVAKGAGGDINVNMMYAQYDDFFLGLLGSAAWSAVVTSTEITYSAANADNSYNDSGSAFVSDGFLQYQWIEVRGFTTAGNNGYCKIATIVAGKITVQGLTLTDEAAGDSVTITMGAQAVNGVAEHWYTFEREYDDLTNMFSLFLGQTVESFTLAIPVTGSITGAFTFIGKEETATVATSGDGSPTASLTNEELTSGNNVDTTLVDYSSVNMVTGNITIANNLRENRIVTAITPNDIGFGSFSVSGDMEIYFTTHAEKTKFLAHTAGSLTIMLEDTAGNAYIFELPEIQYTEDDTSPQGLDSDLTARITFEAEIDDSESIMSRIVKFAA